MPVYKDEKQGTWYVKLYYTDWTGQKRQKMKRGFKLQRDAKEWENDFLTQQAGESDMKFSALVELFLKDYKSRVRFTSYRMRKQTIEKHILPYWKDTAINKITPASVRKWQQAIIDQEYSESYCFLVHSILAQILNYAVKYYGLKQNPCKLAGAMGKAGVRRLNFWTLEEFRKFLNTVTDPALHTAFQVLFFTGLRIGELQALTLADFDQDNDALLVNKTYQRYGSADHVGPPKSVRGVRSVTLPPFLADVLKEYLTHFYDMQPDDRIFQPVTQSKLQTAIKNGCESTGIKRIRIHELRHSHVSMLIDMGFTPFLIAERIGDTPEMINKVYGHLYPNRHQEVADKLNKLVSK